jgi:KAP family P-loop domain
VIQHHIEQDAPDVGFAFLYFNHKETGPRNPTDYIASMLRQLEQQKEALSENVEQSYDKLSNSFQKPDVNSLLLGSSNSFKSRTYIILDALDECEPGMTRNVIETLQALIAINPRVFLFIATRPNVHIDRLVSSLQPNQSRIIDIVTDEGSQCRDLKTYIDFVLLHKSEIKSEERTFISQNIVEKADGL